MTSDNQKSTNFEAVGLRLRTVREVMGFDHQYLYEELKITPETMAKLENDELPFEQASPLIDLILDAIYTDMGIRSYVWSGGDIPSRLISVAHQTGRFTIYDHALATSINLLDPFASKPEPYLPSPGEIALSPSLGETQLDRIERLVTLLQKHRGELTIEENPIASPFTPTIPKGATHYEDSRDSHDGALRFYKLTEENWLYVWGMIHEVNALGWTASELTRRQLRLTKLP